MLWNKFVHKSPIYEHYIYSEKEGWGQQTCDQLEGVKPIHSFHTFQNGDFTVFEDFLAKKNEYMCKPDLRDAYLSVPLSQDDQKSVMFQQKETLYQFLCLCFDFTLTQYVFTKLLKIPTALLRRIRIRKIIYLDDMLIIGVIKEETKALRDTHIILLQCLQFVINQKKSAPRSLMFKL